MAVILSFFLGPILGALIGIWIGTSITAADMQDKMDIVETTYEQRISLMEMERQQMEAERRKCGCFTIDEVMNFMIHPGRKIVERQKK